MFALYYGNMKTYYTLYMGGHDVDATFEREFIADKWYKVSS